MKIEELTGTYNIIGSNQDGSENNYKGTLTLSFDENKRVLAKWLINKNQKQSGKGFFKDNVLVINFNYKGEDDKTYNGVVVYSCISRDILDGFWSEEFGNPLYLGTERCFRVKNSTNLLN